MLTMVVLSRPNFSWWQTGCGSSHEFQSSQQSVSSVSGHDVTMSSTRSKITSQQQPQQQAPHTSDNPALGTKTAPFTMSMQSFYHSVMKVAAPMYQRIVGAELNKMGEFALTQEKGFPLTCRSVSFSSGSAFQIRVLMSWTFAQCISIYLRGG